MKTTPRLSRPFTRLSDSTLEFDPHITEVAILDRSGRPIWKKSQNDEHEAIRWTGQTEAGETVQTGDYICKLAYPNEQVTYLPFVFMKKP